MNTMTYKFDPATDVPDLSGRVVIVTGGKWVKPPPDLANKLISHTSSGLGLETVKVLARHGARVYLAARNRQKGLNAIERIRAAGLSPGNGPIEFLELDLASPKLAKSAAEIFLKKEKRLDILVNNAAAYVFLPRLGRGPCADWDVA